MKNKELPSSNAAMHNVFMKHPIYNHWELREKSPHNFPKGIYRGLYSISTQDLFIAKYMGTYFPILLPAFCELPLSELSLISSVSVRGRNKQKRDYFVDIYLGFLARKGNTNVIKK